MRITEILIGKMLLIGVLISGALVLFGLSKFLLQEGSKVVQMRHVGTISGFSMHQLTAKTARGSGLAYVEMGVIFLFITQLVRALLAAIIFLLSKQKVLFTISMFVFIALLGTILINI